MIRLNALDIVQDIVVLFLFAVFAVRWISYDDAWSLLAVLAQNR